MQSTMHEVAVNPLLHQAQLDSSEAIEDSEASKLFFGHMFQSLKVYSSFFDPYFRTIADPDIKPCSPKVIDPVPDKL